MTMAAPRKYSSELRERAVRMCRTADPDPKPQTKKPAVDLGVHPEALPGDPLGGGHRLPGRRSPHTGHLRQTPHPGVQHVPHGANPAPLQVPGPRPHPGRGPSCR
ncbi:hypothetical protein GCM10027073_12650 [Streptomyces chlorus]